MCRKIDLHKCILATHKDIYILVRYLPRLRYRTKLNPS